MSLIISDNIFKKNDIRGIVGTELTPGLYEKIGQAYAQYIIKRNPNNKNNLWISLCQDARNHSQELVDAILEGLLSSGINVVYFGLCPSPLGYFSEYVDFSKYNVSGIEGAVVVTASHNPPEYNGVKITYKKNSFSEDELLELKDFIKSGNNIKSEKKGQLINHNVVEDYISYIYNSFGEIGKGLKIVVDSGNATGGVVAPELFRKFGCDVVDICTEPDGNFPNHHPDPSKEENLKMLKNKIKECNADFGIAFDGDSDRIGIVDDTCYSIPGDQLLLLFALDILKDKKQGETPVFISEVKCSQVLYNMISENGGNAIMWKTGHAYIKSKMKEENATLAGEMSGHIFFKDKYFGFDDAVYAAARFIKIAAEKKQQDSNFRVSQLINALPQVFNSKEVRIPCPEDLKHSVLDKLEKQIQDNPGLFGAKIEKIITIDGLRVVFNDGFALIRASNTEPTFTLRFEAGSQKNLDMYQKAMLDMLDENMKKVETAV